MHEARVLPGIARLAVRAGLPHGPIVVAEFCALRHGHARLAQPVFDRLAPLPFHPGGGGGDGDKPATILDLDRLLSCRGPFPVGELKQRAADEPRLGFCRCVIPTIGGDRCWLSI